MFHNYSKLIETILIKKVTFLADIYFDQVLIEHFRIKENILCMKFNLLYAFQLYEIIYQTNQAKISHLAFFLQVLTILKFAKNVNSSFQGILTNLREKCFNLIQFTVANLNRENSLINPGIFVYSK